MVCVYCGNSTKVINSRWQKKPNQTWRRRCCQNCKSVFTTIEGVDWQSSLVVTKDSALEPFQRDKLFTSIYESVRYRKTAHRDATALTSTVIGKLLPTIDNGSVQVQTIQDIAVKTLKNFDNAAYIHYTAYHPR